jgi:flagellar motor switch protein FliN/FliY
VTVGTDLAIAGPAVAEAAALVGRQLLDGAQPGESFDLWAAPPPELTDVLGPGSRAWSAPLLGPDGTCGLVALAIGPGTTVLAEDDVAAALSASVSALTDAFGAQSTGPAHEESPASLAQPKAGYHAVAVPLLAGDQRSALLVVSAPAGEVAELPPLGPSAGATGSPRSIAALGEVEMTVSVELGRTRIPIRDLLNIHNGAVVQLDRQVSHPVDIFVHGTLIARGEVVVVDECFAVRVTELLTGD